MAKFPYTVEKEIKGEKYVFQCNGISAWMKASVEFYEEGTSNINPYKLHSYLLENVVVSPKKEIDDFASTAELMEVTTFARKVATGEIQPEKASTDKKDK